jgi:hypothetical protein
MKLKITWSVQAALVTETFVSSADAWDVGAVNGAVEPVDVEQAVVVVTAEARVVGVGAVVLGGVVETPTDDAGAVEAELVVAGAAVVGAAWLDPLLHAASNITAATSTERLTRSP